MGDESLNHVIRALTASLIFVSTALRGQMHERRFLERYSGSDDCDRTRSDCQVGSGDSRRQGVLAGGDLKEFASLGDGLPAIASGLVTDVHAAIYRMNRVPKPFVAGVRGAAGGAGLSFMCAFDLVVAGESAKFTVGYTKVAMTPDGTSTYFLARHVGLRRAMELTLTNRVLSAQEALDWGLVNMVVPDEDVDSTATSLAESLAAGASRSIGVAKRLIYEGYESSLEEAGEREAQEIVKAMATVDGREGISAFASRREPQYRGE